MEQSLPLEKSQGTFCDVLVQTYDLAGFFNALSIEPRPNMVTLL